MPFFRNVSPEQIQKYCENETYDSLRNLNHRYGAFFERLNALEEQNNAAIDRIDIRIAALRIEIAKNAEEMARYEETRESVLSSLPDNQVERYLVLQTLNHSPFNRSPELNKQISDLEKEKRELNGKNAWGRQELHLCVQELRIVNSVLEQKKRELDAQVTADDAMETVRPHQ